MATEIFRCVAGSRLFGTDNPTSDTDYKAVHLPDERDILLGRASVLTNSTGDAESHNGADDVDMTSFPLQNFLQNLAKMETNSVEMLFAPNEVEHGLWDEVYLDRFKFMKANKMAFLGFGRAQAMRYAVRGDRLTTLQAVVDYLKSLTRKKVAETVEEYHEVHSTFASYPDVKVYVKDQPGSEIPHMSVFGREISLTVKPSEAVKVYEKPIKEAGKRSFDAAFSGGPDWKGLYHAQRIIDEGLELFSTGELKFPCAHADYYRLIRNKDLDLEHVLTTFEESLLRLEELKPIPEFQERVDQDVIDDFVYHAYREKVVR